MTTAGRRRWPAVVPLPAALSVPTERDAAARGRARGKGRGRKDPLETDPAERPRGRGPRGTGYRPKRETAGTGDSRTGRRRERDTADESVYRPDSVPAGGGGRSSISACRRRQALAAYPQARAGHPQTPAQAGLATGPFGLAPGGVYRATPVTRGAGGLLPHRFTLTPAAEAPEAVCFLWHYPAGHPGLLLATTLPCGVRTFLGDVPSANRGGHRRDRPTGSSAVPARIRRDGLAPRSR